MAKKSFTSVLDDNYIYISHLDEKFQFWKLPTWPDTVTDTMQSNFASTNALGRTAPVYTFSNSGPRTVQISIPLHRDIMDDVNIGISNVFLGEGEDYVDNLLKALQSIALPRYNLQNKAVEPPLVAIRLSNEIFIKGVVSGAIGLTYSKPILSNGKYARVDLSITVSEVDPYDATSVFKNGGFRGVVQSLKKGMNLED
jgi:hypothetical protein